MGGVGWVGWGVHSHYIFKPNLVLRLGWGFDNKSGYFLLKHPVGMVTIIVMVTVFGMVSALGDQRYSYETMRELLTSLSSHV